MSISAGDRQRLRALAGQQAQLVASDDKPEAMPKNGKPWANGTLGAQLKALNYDI